MPPSIFQVKAGPPLKTSSVDDGWSVCTNLHFEYRFQYPTDWHLSIPPKYLGRRARMVESPSLPSVAILAVPFNLYDADEQVEIKKAESSYLGQHVVESQASAQLNGRQVFHRVYACTVDEGGSLETRRAEAVFVVARPWCHALFLRGKAEEVEKARPVFDSVVASFRSAKILPRPLPGDRVASVAFLASSPSTGASAVPGATTPMTVLPSGAPSTAPLGQTEDILRSYLEKERDEWQQTDRILETMGLKTGDRIVDVGAGSGYFTWHFSRAVGATGRVFAADIDPAAIRFLRQRAEQEPLPFPNVDFLLTSIDDIKLPADTVDWGFLCEAHFIVEADPYSTRCVQTLYRAMRPGGRVAVIEARKDPIRGDLSVDRLSRLFLKAGFVTQAAYDFLEREHFVIFVRKK